ncbi:MAG: hypothetical protein ACMUIM_04645 [bacterium]
MILEPGGSVLVKTAGAAGGSTVVGAGGATVAAGGGKAAVGSGTTGCGAGRGGTNAVAGGNNTLKGRGVTGAGAGYSARKARLATGALVRTQSGSMGGRKAYPTGGLTGCQVIDKENSLAKSVIY